MDAVDQLSVYYFSLEIVKSSINKFREIHHVYEEDKIFGIVDPHLVKQMSELERKIDRILADNLYV